MTNGTAEQGAAAEKGKAPPIERLDASTSDLARQNAEKIAALFPDVATEGPEGEGPHIDFDLLRQALSDHLVEGPAERYRLDWPGKRQAMLLANTPTTKILRPVRGESVNFDTTRNLFIEGDNLEALKILQETYLGKVKMIYIDPPYNTGKDFIYRDNFRRSIEEELDASGQADEAGRLVANTEANGRFHSDWLNMMAPRLKLARSLLRDDGVMFLSISDEEAGNVRLVLDDLFGSENFVEMLTVEMSTTSGPKTVNAQQGTIVKNVEFVFIYRKSRAFDDVPHTPLFDSVSSYDTHYTGWMSEDGSLASLADIMLADEIVGQKIKDFGFAGKGKFSIKDIDRLLAVSPEAQRFINQHLEFIVRYDRAPVSAQNESVEVGKWSKYETDHRTYYLTALSNGGLQALMPLSLNYRTSDDYKPRFGRTVIRGDLWKGFYQDMGNVAKEGKTKFDNGKKPVRLLRQLIKWASSAEDDICLDFFAGSGTTAHAIAMSNIEDNTKRQFIAVQIDEEANKESGAEGSEFDTIAQLSRERIRRAGAKILADHPEAKDTLDIGFRAFRIDESNYHDTRLTTAQAAAVATDDAARADLLDGMTSHIKDDRTDEDLLFGALLAWGVDITLPVRRDTVEGRDVLLVDAPEDSAEGAALIACFARDVDVDLASALAALKPLRVVFRDDGFVNDATKENVASRFKQIAPDTTLRVL